MNYEHEVVVPRAGMPFRIDIFEGRRGNYTREPHWHNSVELFAVYEGSLTFIFREKQIRVDCGDFIIINTNELHSVRADEENMSVYVQIPISESCSGVIGLAFAITSVVSADCILLFFT